MNPAQLLTIFTALTGKTLDDIIAEANKKPDNREPTPRYWRHIRRYWRIYARGKKAAK